MGTAVVGIVGVAVGTALVGFLLGTADGVKVVGLPDGRALGVVDGNELGTVEGLLVGF